MRGSDRKGLLRLPCKEVESGGLSDAEGAVFSVPNRIDRSAEIASKWGKVGCDDAGNTVG